MSNAKASNNKSNKAALRTIAPEELKRHNKYNDAWLAIHGVVYDVTEWASRHPGGNVILLGAGTDSTVLFESYHPQGVASAVLDKYAIGRLPDAAAKTFYDWNGEFYPTLKARVVEHLRGKDLNPRGGLVPKALAILAFLVVGWYWMCFAESLGVAVAGSLVFALASTHIGLGIMHDGSHGAFSVHPWLNTLATMGMDLIGASGFVWEFQHVVGHHPFTNLQSKDKDGNHTHESDPDTFSSYPLVRMHKNDKRRWFNRYQHLYAPVMFGLMTLSRCFMADFKSVVGQDAVMHLAMTPRMSNPLNLARFWLMKALTVLLFIVLPVYTRGVGVGLGLFALAHFVCSFYLAVCFIVNHISERWAARLASESASSTTVLIPPAPFFVAGDDPILSLKQQAHLKAQKRATKSANKRDWAAMQVAACVNWCSGSWFWNHFSGGLNHQVEHHLFPSVAHVHYPAISKIVQDTCVEFGVPYISHGSFYAAWKDMIAHLYVLGTKY